VSSPQHIAPSDQHAPRAAPGRVSAALGLLILLSLPATFIVRIYQATNSHLLSPGDPVPVLTARDPASNKIQNVTFKTMPTALLFFSADCPHCQRELTNFDRLGKRFGDRILFLAISMSNMSKTTELVSADHILVRILLDEERKGQNRFGVDAVPALFLVGTDEAIVYSGSGEKSFASREQLLLEFINSIRSAHN
jgi:peroxiredoxin